MLGQAYQDASEPAGTLSFYGRVLDRAPEDQDIRLQRGQLALAMGLTQRAADDFDRVLAADPTRDPARYHRARALNRLGRYREALVDLDVLIGRNPNDFMFYELRAIAHESVGKLEPARLDREQAISLLPKSPEVLNNQAWPLANGSLAQRDPDRAILMARQAVALAPDQSMYLNTFGVALYRAGRYAEAVDVLERSLAAGRGELDAFDLFFLAMARHRLGDAASARADFDRAVRWIDAHPHVDARWLTELKSFRAESETVLADPPGELPADVFAPATDR
jgi:tetratricopeptide (TPR) repeat protein